MIFKRPSRIYIALFLLLFGASWSFAQTDEQKSLEAKRERLLKEITEINRLLFAETREKGNVLDQIEALDQKVNVRQELIKVTNQQSNLLSRKINANIRNISTLKNELKALKDDYAAIIQKSYQNKSRESRLMFLLSSEDFFQAFKRLQYMKQYADFRREQGEQIVIKTEELTKLNQDLNNQRKEKDRLIAENQKAKDQ
ncbi:MAG: peptidase M23, partial [Flavobacteriales bacterium]